jgi:alginate biosynthesis protein AlgX
MKRFFVLLALCAFLDSSLVFSQIVTICPEGTATTTHEEWWPVPGFIPASDGWVFGEWDLRTNFSIPDDVLPYMKRLVDALKAKRITVVGIPIPSRGMLHAAYLDKSNPLAAAYSPETATQNYLAAIKQYEGLGMVMVNPLPYLTETPDRYDFKIDMHWRPEGARQIAQAVADTLTKLPEVAALPKSTYILSEASTGDYEGVYTKDMTRLCNTPLPKEPFQRFEISGGPEVGLLDEAQPNVMLLGSSFSGEDFAFDKFLKVATGLDITTLSTDGGTKWYSLERLFMTDGTPLPKIILWEFPAIDIKGWETSYLRRIIPMVYGACTSKRTLQTEERTLSTHEKTLIENLEGLPITGSKYFAQLEFPDVTLRDFTINFLYKDGSSEPVRVQRFDRVENEGRYLVELSEALTGILDKIEFQEGEYQGLVTTKLCSVN